MSMDWDARRWPLTTSGTVVVLVTIVLTGIGILSIYATEIGGDPDLPTTKRQAMYAVCGMIAAWGIFRVSHVRIGEWAWPMFAGVLISLVLLVVARYVSLEPLIRERRGTWRWITVGPIGIQPSEIMKFVYVLALAHYLRFRSNYRTLRGLVVPFVITLVPLTLILKEPDLGTSLLFLPVLFVMLFVAGARLRHLAVVLCLGAATVPIYYFSPLMSNYQKQRIQVLFRQNTDDVRWIKGPGFQLHQSKTAIGSGGWTGRSDEADGGFFRHNLLPEDHNDFIFAVVAHTWGFLGAMGLLGVYVALLIAGLTAAAATDDPFSRLVGVGITTMIGVQALFNMAMTIGITPITGLTLPFVSSGGSSLVANFIAIGLLISVSRHRPLRVGPKPFVFYDDDVIIED
jgi:cell division protein FtsW (lipid II flippase)